MIFYLLDIITLLSFVINPRIIFCEYDTEDARYALGLTFQTALFLTEGTILISIQTPSLIQCGHKCLNEPFCEETMFLDGNECVLLVNDKGRMDVTSNLQGTGVYTKFGKVVTEVSKGTSDPKVCDKGYLAFKSSGVISCFAPYDRSAEWYSAKMVCETDEGYLAKTDTKEKLKGRETNTTI